MPRPSSLKKTVGLKKKGWPDPRLYRLALAGALSITTYLALVPATSSPVRELNDKLSHFLAFYVLAFLADFSFPASNRFLLKMLPLLAYGLGIELMQAPLPSRMFSWLDLTADFIGLLVYGLCLLVVNRRPLKRLRV